MESREEVTIMVCTRCEKILNRKEVDTKLSLANDVHTSLKVAPGLCRDCKAICSSENNLGD